MMYYKQTQNDSVRMLMEVLKMEAQENPVWTFLYFAWIVHLWMTIPKTQITMTAPI